MTSVSFQGEHGAYGESAAFTFFGDKISTMPFPTFSDTLQATQLGATDFAILPIENSIEGSVGESYDILYETALHVIGEVYQKIQHCLIGNGQMKQIDTVMSHTQALGQCRKFIQKNNMKTIPTYDTAGSVKLVIKMGRDNIACIASEIASKIYNVPILKTGIADNSNNYTRFLILTKKDNDDGNKTSIILSIKHESGALFRIIEKFNSYDINLTKIESRPKKNTIGEYNFYIDFEGNKNDSQIKELLKKIKDETLFLKVLGTYNLHKL